MKLNDIHQLKHFSHELLFFSKKNFVVRWQAILVSPFVFNPRWSNLELAFTVHISLEKWWLGWEGLFFKVLFLQVLGRDFSTEKMVDFSLPQFCGWSGVMGIKGFVGSWFFWTFFELQKEGKMAPCKEFARPSENTWLIIV